MSTINLWSRSRSNPDQPSSIAFAIVTPDHYPFYLYRPGSSLVVPTNTIVPDRLLAYDLYQTSPPTHPPTRRLPYPTLPLATHPPLPPGLLRHLGPTPASNRHSCLCTPAPHLLIPGTTSGPFLAIHICMTTSCNPRPCSWLRPWLRHNP